MTAGISLISVAAGSAGDVAGYSAAAAASLVGVLGLFNGGGRILWGWLSDRIGKMPAFMGILGIQGVCLLLIPHVASPILFAVLAALVYTCYGGAFGTMPSTAGRFFGVRNAGAIYGLMLIGWSIGGIVGPLLISSLIGEQKAYTLGFTVVGIIALVGMALPHADEEAGAPDGHLVRLRRDPRGHRRAAAADRWGHSRTSGGSSRQGQPGGQPRLDPADDVGGPGQPEPPQGVGRQRAAVALAADDDDVHVEVCWPPGSRTGLAGVEPPLEHRAVDDERARQVSLPGALRLGAGVDEQSPTRLARPGPAPA